MYIEKITHYVYKVTHYVYNETMYIKKITHYVYIENNTLCIRLIIMVFKKIIKKIMK